MKHVIDQMCWHVRWYIQERILYRIEDAVFWRVYNRLEKKMLIDLNDIKSQMKEQIKEDRNKHK